MSYEPRLNYHTAAPEATHALVAFAQSAGSTLGLRLCELVKLRLSQINGCAVCMDIHGASLLRDGIDPRHLNTLAGWREAQRFFNARESAALAWAEAVNAIPQRIPSDAEFGALREHFSDTEIAELSYVVCAIRAFNMLNVSFCLPVPAQPFIPNH